MHDYTFTGAYPRVLVGLSQGVNANLSPDVPYGSTIEVRPGDTVSTDEPYEHPELMEIVPKADTIPVPADQGYVLPVGDTSGIDVLRPAAEAVTAEGAPAPTEPAAS